MSAKNNPVPEPRDAKAVAVAALLMLSVIAGIGAAQLTISSGRIVQGSSAFITYNLVLNQPYSRCWGVGNFMALVLSGAGQGCVNPSYVTYYCDQATPASGGGTINQPPPPCLLNAYGSQTQGPSSGSNVCTAYYYTNQSLLQGTYNICAYYSQYTSGFPPSQYYVTYGTQPLNISTNNYTGISSGLLITWPTSPNGQTWSGGTSTLYLQAYSGAGSTYASFNPNYDICTSANSNCYVELGNALSSGGGCVSPLTPNGMGVQLPNCPTSSGSPSNTPCLLSTSMVTPQQYSISFPSWLPGTTGNYIACAYQYNVISYPSGTSATTSDGNPHPYVSQFFASAPVNCASGTCTAQASSQQSSEIGVTQPGGFPYGSLSPVPSSAFNVLVQQTQNPVIVFNGIALPLPSLGESYNALSLYDEPVANFVFLGQIGPQQACLNLYDSVSGADLCSSSPTSPCVETFAPSSSGSCSVIGGSGQDTCSQTTTTYGVGSPSQQTTLMSVTGQQYSQIGQLPVGNYLFCGYFTVPSQPPQLLGVIPLQILPNSQTSSTTNPAAANTLVLQGVVCGEYTVLSTAVLLIALILVVAGAVLHAGASVLPAEPRGVLRSYAMSMILGGIAGVIIFVLSGYLLSVLSNGQFSATVTTSCAAVSGLGIPPTVPLMSTSTSTISSVTPPSQGCTDEASLQGTNNQDTFSGGPGASQDMEADYIGTCNVIIDPGVTLYTNGWSIITTGDFFNYGTIITNPSSGPVSAGGYATSQTASFSCFFGLISGSSTAAGCACAWTFVSPGEGDCYGSTVCCGESCGGSAPASVNNADSYAGQGGGGGGASQTNNNGWCTGGYSDPGASGGSTAQLSSDNPGKPGLSETGLSVTSALLNAWYNSGMSTYLEGTSGGGGGDSSNWGSSCSGGTGGPGAYGLYVQAESITNNGVIYATGGTGQAGPSSSERNQYTGGTASSYCGAGGGGGGGTVIFAYNGVYTPGTIFTLGGLPGAPSSGAQTAGGPGGAGATVPYNYGYDVPVSVQHPT